MSANNIEVLKEAKNQLELYAALLKIFGLDDLKGVDGKLGEIMQMDRAVFSRMAHPNVDKKGNQIILPYSMKPENHKKLCKAIADKLGISSDEVAELTKHSLIQKGSKTANTKEDLPINGPYQKELRKRLCDDITYILDKLGYHWKDNQPKDSKLELAITGKVQRNSNPDEQEIYIKNELTRVFGISVFEVNRSERRFNDVLAWVTEMEPKKKAVIILCCDGYDTFLKVRDRRAFKQYTQHKNIWIKEFGNDKPLQLQSYYEDKRVSMKDVMERLLEELLVSDEISHPESGENNQLQPDIESAFLDNDN